MRTTPVLAAAAALIAAGAAVPATAAPRKPITKTYTATAPLPDPSNYAEQSPYSVCAQAVPQSYDSEEFKAPGAGKLKVELNGFQGDWDLLLLDSKGAEIANSGGTQPVDPAVESLTAKVKKAGTVYTIIACNWAGGPTGTVKYTFTWA
ncbi:MAG TPA: hypothetical protein VGX28_03865 [Frankiaceae bacterium]|jgi:hypothetical protein|nr:hypothetical protein [Frankiaceae bacterium]